MVKINSNTQVLTSERAYNFYLENRILGKKYTVKHFIKEKIPESTIYRIIERAENGFGPIRKLGSGRIAKKMTKPNITKLKAMFDHKDNVTQTQSAKKFNCHQSFISKTLARHSDIQCRKKTKIPLRTEAQKAIIRTKCGRLYRKFHNFDWVMDDESYFTLKHSTINGNKNFYSSDLVRLQHVSSLTQDQNLRISY